MTLKKPIIFETTFTTYTATEIIGEGGSGKIYKVTDESGKIWAVKLLDSAKATKEKVRRFKNELMFCLKNQHPNIVTVIDHGVFKDSSKSSPFYVTPLYFGSLRSLTNSGISPDKVLPYFSKIMDGVEAAHLKKVVHRDIKPENILYDKDKDNLLIADFGIAQFEEDDLYTAVETKNSARLANFQYAAPEQRGRDQEVDQRADIYALGLIMNELFTGEVPYGTGYKTISSVAPDYKYLDDLVAEMLRQSPNDRLPNIEQVKQQLIGHKNNFVTRQRISELENTVIPVTEIDDPLIVDPPRLINFDWNNGTLTLIFQRNINQLWRWAFLNMGSHSSLAGKGPEQFSLSGDKATIAAEENQVQPIINFFKNWIPNINQVYKLKVQQEKEDSENEQRKLLELQTKGQQARQRILTNVKI
ncbi:MAG: serine/threonine protein kinase [Nitrospina sp.]|nr:MAG: serine/threonine protein kinase [Nitrospina sp.]